jgi:hypothetical protein
MLRRKIQLDKLLHEVPLLSEEIMAVLSPIIFLRVLPVKPKFFVVAPNSSHNHCPCAPTVWTKSINDGTIHYVYII